MIQNTDHGPQSLTDYREFLLRRKWQIIVPFLLIFAAVSAVAYLLPPVYRSSATILIESQQVPQDLIRTTVTSYAEERINAITQQILSRQVLLNIIKDFDLYPDERERITVEEILDEMRGDIAIEMVSAEVPDRRGGKSVTVNVAFTVAYENLDPQKAMRVANKLASLFLEHNLRMREALAETTTKLLGQQLEQYRRVTRDLEERIARFKETHMAELPELMQLNQDTERQLGRQIESTEEQVRNLQDRKIYLEGQLATVSPTPPLVSTTGQYILDPRDRLRALKNQALTLEASLSPKHPDVVKIRREIDGLEKEIGATEEQDQVMEQLRLKEAELKELKARVTEKHPDLIRLLEEIDGLKEKAKSYEQMVRAGLDLAQADPTNPAYINLQTQIKAVEIDLKGLKERRGELDAKWQDYVKRLERMPEVEREYRELTRDYNTAANKYAETTAKLMEARQGQSLEESQAGEKFTIIDPPQLPEKPIKPKRLAIVLIGLILGVGAGIGGAAVVEFSDSTIRSQKDVRRITGEPPLAVMPDVQEVQKMRGSRS
jgi:succinoglycan biosynthesis transport protein ExoP